MSTCYKTSDNKYFGCPPRMADGRHFTDYRPSCEINATIRDDNKLKNSHDYRNFLQQNANTLLNVNRKHACMKNCCSPCESFKNSTMLPSKYNVKCDAHTCTRVLNDPKGLGDGRVYFTSPPSCDGLPATWPQNLPENQCATLDDRFAYYGDMQHSNSVQRVATPSGGKILGGGDPKLNQ